MLVQGLRMCFIYRTGIEGSSAEDLDTPKLKTAALRTHTLHQHHKPSILRLKPLATLVCFVELEVGRQGTICILPGSSSMDFAQFEANPAAAGMLLTQPSFASST